MPDPPALPGPLPSAPWRQRAIDVCAALGIDAGRLARRVVIVAALAVVAGVGLLVLRGSGGGEPPELHLPRAGSAAEPDAAPSDSTVAGEITYAHAAGAVSRPGVYRVPPGARVADLLDAAGGPTGDADVDQLNLAAPVADGERIYVPKRGEAPPPAAGTAPTGAAKSGPVNLNSATLEQLDALPGVGPATAQAILDYRAQHGRFRSVEELLEVRGIGEAKLADLRDRVLV